MSLLQMSGISKSFGATAALRDVSLSLEAGEILALLGENGAGKSTLMQILSGALAPDVGTIELDGVPFRPAHPHAARVAGIAMIYQELNLAPDLSVEDNIMLGQERSQFGLLQRSEQRRLVQESLAQLGHADLPLHLPVGQLSVGTQQIVEIARALVAKARVLVLDEPTSSLTETDVQQLFTVLRRLQQAGIGVIYISHFLEEIRSICSRYLVLRDGSPAGSGDLAQTTEAQIVALMVGRPVEDLYPQVPRTRTEPLLQITNLSGSGRLRDVDLHLHRGEILGVAGLIGSGRTRLLRTLFGLEPTNAGTVTLAGQSLTGGARQRIRAGLGLVSEDRKREGLAQSQSLVDNLTWSRLAPYSSAGWLNLRQRTQAARVWLSQLQVKARSPAQLATTLSGGNQQKVSIARVLHQQAEVLLLDEPTRGIDVGTKAQIYRLMGEQAAAGKGIVFVSSYFQELLAMCDRIALMSRGRIIEVRPANEWTEEELLAAALR